MIYVAHVAGREPYSLDLDWRRGGRTSSRGRHAAKEVICLPSRFKPLGVRPCCKLLPCVYCCPLAAGVWKQCLHCSSSRSTHHLPPTTVVFLLVLFSNLPRFVSLGIITRNQIVDFKYCFVLRVLFHEEIDCDYSQLPVVRRLFYPWAVRAVVYGDV